MDANDARRAHRAPSPITTKGALPGYDSRFTGTVIELEEAFGAG